MRMGLEADLKAAVLGVGPRELSLLPRDLMTSGAGLSGVLGGLWRKSRKPGDRDHVDTGLMAESCTEIVLLEAPSEMRLGADAVRDLKRILSLVLETSEALYMC